MRVASGDLKMQRILKHLTEPTGERQHPFGTRLCPQSLVCYTLVPADAEKGLLLIWRASFLWQKDERAGVVSDRF